MAGPPGDERDAECAAHAGIRIGHVTGSRLVPRMNELKARVERRVEHGHDVIAREREHMLHARMYERARECVSAATFPLARVHWFSPRYGMRPEQLSCAFR